MESENLIKSAARYFKCVWKDGEWPLVYRMLLDTTRLFQNNNIPYFISYGTFLGAVRCRNVIPWDDDLDFGMLGEDELRLKKLEPELNKLGYSICSWSIPWIHGELKFYKLWITSLISDTGLPFSWPFVDIFVFRSTDDADKLFDDHRKIKLSELFPLKTYRFGPLELLGPNSFKMLIDQYGSDYMTTCVSSSWNHKRKCRKVTQSLSFDVLDKLGYCVDVHLMDRYGLDKYPQHLDDVEQFVCGDTLEVVSGDGSRFRLNDSMALIWSWSDGTRDINWMVESISDHYQIPVIDVTITIIDTIRKFYHSNLISLHDS